MTKGNCFWCLDRLAFWGTRSSSSGQDEGCVYLLPDIGMKREKCTPSDVLLCRQSVSDQLLPFLLPEKNCLLLFFFSWPRKLIGVFISWNHRNNEQFFCKGLWTTCISQAHTNYSPAQRAAHQFPSVSQGETKRVKGLMPHIYHCWSFVHLKNSFAIQILH